MLSLMLNIMPLNLVEDFYRYATLHIGLCAAASAVLIVVVSLAGEEFKHRFRKWFIIVLITFMLAGAFGGVVAGHIIYTGYEYPRNLYEAAFFFMYFLFWLGLATGLAGLWRVARHETPPVKPVVNKPHRHPAHSGKGRRVMVTPHIFQVVRVADMTKGRGRKAHLSVYVPAARAKEFR